MNSALLLTSLCLLLGTAPEVTNGVWTVDNFGPETLSQWYESAGTPWKLEGTDSGAGFTAAFSKLPNDPRSSFDKSFAPNPLDLSAWNRFELEVSVDNPDIFSYSALYFRSGKGWYSSSGGLPAGRGKLTYRKSDFNSEGAPAGWDKIDGVRLSFWKAKPGDSRIVYHALRFIQEPILFASVLNDQGVAPWVGTNNGRLLGESLHRLGLAADTVTFSQTHSDADWLRQLENRSAVIVLLDRFLSSERRAYLEKWSENTKIPVKILNFDCQQNPLTQDELVTFLSKSETLSAQLKELFMNEAVTAIGFTDPAVVQKKANLEKICAEEGLAKMVDVCLLSHQKLLREQGLKISKSETLKFRGWWNHDGLGAYKGDWPRTARELKAAGYTDVFPNLVWAGAAMYQSKYIPTGDMYKQWGDQLDACIKACHAQGIKVNVWKVNFNAKWHRTDAWLAQMRAQGRLQKDFKGEEIPWLCPSHPDNIALEVGSMVELATEHPVDGVHFDYIRYESGCFCDGCRARFEKSIGQKVGQWPQDCGPRGTLYEPWSKWRAQQITHIVRETYRKVKAVRPECTISAAVFSGYPDCVTGVGQDWAAWAKEGIVDFLCPMDYTQQTDMFARMIKRQQEIVGADFPLYPGIGEWRLSPDGVIDQIQTAQRLNCRGFMIFNLTEKAAGNILPLTTP